MTMQEQALPQYSTNPNCNTNRSPKPMCNDAKVGSVVMCGFMLHVCILLNVIFFDISILCVYCDIVFKNFFLRVGQWQLF